MDSITITLAGEPYTIQALTVGQLEELSVGSIQPISSDTEQAVRDHWKQIRGVILAALSADHPKMDEAAVRGLRLGNLKNARRVRDEILRFAGLIEPEPPTSGEGSVAPGEGGAATA